jgi:hypothetical protein
MIPLRSRIAGVIGSLLLVASACGGSPSLDDYSREVEQLVHAMNQRLDDALRGRPSPETVEWAQGFWAERADARWDFVRAVGDLEVPNSAIDIHNSALDLLTQLAQAESDLAELAASAETMEEVRAFAEGPEAAVFANLDARAIEFCRAAQAQLDATETAEAFTDMPFIPNEMQEVVIVAFRCTAEERGIDP